MKLGELEFKVEDFLNQACDCKPNDVLLAKSLAERANRILAGRLEKAEQVYEKRIPAESNVYSIVWATYETDEGYLTYKKTGYTARLVCIEELPKEKK